MVSHIDVVSVPVTDQDVARDFYVDVLGFRVLADEPMGPGMRWVQLGLEGAQTSITLVTWFDAMPPGSLKGLVLATDDIEATVAELEGRGLEFHQPVERESWGTFTTFDDPDGNGWVLAQSASG